MTYKEYNELYTRFKNKCPWVYLITKIEEIDKNISVSEFQLIATDHFARLPREDNGIVAWFFQTENCMIKFCKHYNLLYHINEVDYLPKDFL